MDFDSIVHNKTPERFKKIVDVLAKRQHDLKVVMENVHDPHNISACLRSCDAAGVKEVDLVYHSGQVRTKLGNQSSASAKKWVDAKYYSSVGDCFANLKREGFKIFTTHLDTKSIDLYDIDFTQKIAVVFGNEHSGISKEALELSDENFQIPQFGMIHSLNISVSVAVTLYEALRQRLSAGFYKEIRINDNEFENLLKNWLQR